MWWLSQCAFNFVQSTRSLFILVIIFLQFLVLWYFCDGFLSTWKVIYLYFLKLRCVAFSTLTLPVNLLHCFVYLLAAAFFYSIFDSLPYNKIKHLLLLFLALQAQEVFWPNGCCYPTPFEGLGHCRRPWSPKSRATLLGLDQRS